MVTEELRYGDNDRLAARVAQMIGLLQTQGIEVSRAAAPFKVDEGAFPAGTYVVKLDQPFRHFERIARGERVEQLALDLLA